MSIPQDYPILPRESTLAQLPPAYPADTQDQISQLLISSTLNRLVVLDDDPTGTQTCHDISVLTVWDILTLTEEFKQNSPGFFILTNSRALPPLEAEKLIREICENVAQVAKSAGETVDIVLRGDSTLRGHFPLETDVAQSVFGDADGLVLAPFFFQGGRFTIDDVHYVAEGENLVPAGMTQFAKDATFGYKSSNLRDYVVEKAAGRFQPEQLHSISIHDIREGGPEAVFEKLMNIPRGGVIIVNAAAESDMHVFVAGLLLAEAKGKHFLYRTGAASETGGLIIAGSYVPKTTAQLNVLTSKRGQTGQLVILEMDVEELIASPESAAGAIQRTVQEADSHLQSGQDTLVMTSRKLITGDSELSSLAIGTNVASALVSVLRQVQVRPRYIIAKGGITSSDAATKGLNMKRALIVGQAALGCLCGDAMSPLRDIEVFLLWFSLGMLV
ncbi:hypothetical protein AARAC_002440 [Aspergillus arachidicola]|uniref:Uncharacterized protein n=1 Tax=Aspergillus arachidicola TaxID=656916 RepID=A0A2G7FVF0_9EURO|nr:hypothetical protein AARAC_002440 [Aspergillus arachidicola]